MSFKGRLHIAPLRAEISPQDPEIHVNATYTAIFRYGPDTKKSSKGQGSRSGPQWSDTTAVVIDIDPSVPVPEITIGITGAVESSTTPFGCGKTTINVQQLVNEKGQLGSAQTVSLQCEALPVKFPSVIMPEPHDDIMFFMTVYFSIEFRGQMTEAGPVNPTHDYLAPPADLLLQPSIAPPLYDAPPPATLSPYAPTYNDSPEKPQDKTLDSAPPTYENQAPPMYLGSPGSAIVIEDNLQLDPNDPNSCPRNLPAGVSTQGDPFDYGWYSLTPGKTLDLHLPLYPTPYVGQTAMQTRSLQGVTGPNTEKSGENLPSQLLYLEKMINSSLTMDEVQELRNLSQRPALLPLDKRYADSRFHEQWRDQNPHALYGSCKTIHFYFTACSPDFPGFLVGVQQEFDTGVVYSGGISTDSMKKYIEFGYTQVNVQKQYGPQVKIAPNVVVISFQCDDYDFISQLDVLSCEYGVLAVRVFTAAGQCSKMLFNRQFVNPALTDKEHHRDMSKLPGFKLESLPFIPRYFPSVQGKFGALAYLATFSRTINVAVGNALNVNNPQEYAPVKEFIGGIRAYITHPVVKSEVTNNPQPTPKSSPVSSPYDSSGPHDDVVVAINTPSSSNPAVQAQVQQDLDKYGHLGSLSIGPSSPTSTPASTAKTYTVASGSDDECCCGPSQMEENDWWPAFLWPTLANIGTLLAIGIVGLIFCIPMLNRAKDLTGLCVEEKTGSTAILVSFFLSLGFAGVLFLFSLIMMLLQCCGNEQEREPHIVLRVIYGIFLVIGLITSAVGLKCVIFMPDPCIITSEKVVGIILHALLLVTPLLFLIGAAINHKRSRWYAEAFVIQWVVTVFAILGAIVGLIVLGAASSRRRY